MGCGRKLLCKEPCCSGGCTIFGPNRTQKRHSVMQPSHTPAWWSFLKVTTNPATQPWPLCRSFQHARAMEAVSQLGKRVSGTSLSPLATSCVPDVAGFTVHLSHCAVLSYSSYIPWSQSQIEKCPKNVSRVTALRIAVPPSAHVARLQSTEPQMLGELVDMPPQSRVY